MCTHLFLTKFSSFFFFEGKGFIPNHKVVSLIIERTKVHTHPHPLSIVTFSSLSFSLSAKLIANHTFSLSLSLSLCVCVCVITQEYPDLRKEVWRLTEVPKPDKLDPKLILQRKLAREASRDNDIVGQQLGTTSSKKRSKLHISL